MIITIKDCKEVSLNDSDLNRLYDIVTHAYAVTEEPMFGPGYERTPLEDIQNFVNSNQLLIAYIDQQIVGCIRHYFVDKGVYSFGLLSADFDFLGAGIGRALVERVESVARKKGATSIKIEIVRPTHQQLEIKEQLDAWYQRSGYLPIGSEPLSHLSQKKADESIVHCCVDYYKKSL